MTGISDRTLEWIFKGARKAGLDFDLDIGSPLYGLLPDHRDPLFNDEEKSGWDWKDGFIGSGLKDRDFGGITIDQLDETIMRRWHDPKMLNTRDGEYRPKSLEDYWDYIKASPSEPDISLDAEIFDGITYADRELRQPRTVEEYIVRAQDSWKSIAYDIYENEQYWKALFIFNFNHGIVYDPEILHATRKILIPRFE
jgi:hypothetical protein